jgi:hypothetical protein
MMRSLKVAVVGVGLFLATAANAQADNNSGATPPEFFPCPGAVLALSGGNGFFSAGEVKVFNLVPFGNGKVQVSTRDLFLFGPDIWRAELHEVKANGNSPGKSKSGNGSQVDFTGVVAKGVKIGRSYQTMISPDNIPAGFAAGMEACVFGPVFISFVP